MYSFVLNVFNQSVSDKFFLRNAICTWIQHCAQFGNIMTAGFSRCSTSHLLRSEYKYVTFLVGWKYFMLGFWSFALCCWSLQMLVELLTFPSYPRQQCCKLNFFYFAISAPYHSFLISLCCKEHQIIEDFIVSISPETGISQAAIVKILACSIYLFVQLENNAVWAFGPQKSTFTSDIVFQWCKYKDMVVPVTCRYDAADSWTPISDSSVFWAVSWSWHFQFFHKSDKLFAAAPPAEWEGSFSKDP